MPDYHCPKCNISFQHDKAEVVFCPQCHITLATRINKSEEQNVAKSSFSRRWMVLLCGVLILVGAGYVAWQLIDLTHDVYPALIVLGVVMAGGPKFVQTLLTDAGKKHREKRKNTGNPVKRGIDITQYHSLSTKDVWPTLKIVIWCVIAIQMIAFFGIYIFQGNQPLNPVVFTLSGPLWCGFSYPAVRFFTKEYSSRIGLLSLLVWGLSLGAFLIIPALILSKTFTAIP